MALIFEDSQKVTRRKAPVPERDRQYYGALYNALQKITPKNNLKNLKSLASTKKYNKKGTDAKANGENQNLNYVSVEDAKKRMERMNPNDMTQGGQKAYDFYKRTIQRARSQEKVSPVEPPKPTSNAVKPPKIEKPTVIKKPSGTITCSKSKKTVIVNESSLPLLVESTNSKRANAQTRGIMADYLGKDINDPYIIKLEKEFESDVFSEGKNKDWFIVLEPLFAKLLFVQEVDPDEFDIYLNYMYRKATTFERPSAYINQIKQMTSFDQIKEFLNPQMEKDKVLARKNIDNMEENRNTNYEVIGPVSYDKANYYGNFSGLDGGDYSNTRICYTQDEETWDKPDYSNMDVNKCYILLRNDWEKYNNNPQLATHDGSEANNGLGELSKYNGYDDYGLSMIFVWITRNGALHECNTRWNHKARYAPGRNVDQALTDVDLSNLMGGSIYKILGIKSFEEAVVEVQKKLKSWYGGSLDAIFDYCGEFNDRICAVNLCDKWNYVHMDGYILSPNQWFDDCSDFQNGFGEVELGDKCNYINTDGEILSPNKWFDYCYSFNNGFAEVKDDGKMNFINTEGQIISPDLWFDGVLPFKNGLARVDIKNKYNFIKGDGQLLSPNQWFDDGYNFQNGFGIVKLDGITYKIDTNGRLSYEVDKMGKIV